MTSREQLAVDRCLDRGGSFDYACSTCDFANDHRYHPYLARHPVRVPVVLAMSIVLAGVALFARRIYLSLALAAQRQIR